MSAGAVVSSNISPDVDFTLSYTGNYTISRYSQQPLSNGNYFYHTAGVRINLIFLEGSSSETTSTTRSTRGLQGATTRTS